MTRRPGALIAALLAVAACSGPTADGADGTSGSSVAAPPTTLAPEPTSTAVPDPTSTVVVSAAMPDEPEPVCVVTVVAGDFLAKIAGALDGISVSDIQTENRLTDAHVLHPGDLLDVCIDNGLDDVTGASRLAPEYAAVRRQQTKLNALFEPYRIAALAVDGDSGPLTRRMLCAARMGLGLPVTASHMAEDSPAEAALFAADELAIPEGAAVWSDRWILIDQTCQVMFVGEGDDRIVNVYPTSTGEPGFETRNSRAVAAFRYDPAVETGGWHDSTNFPVEVDNPLNGNMYKPIYWDLGQAIHGAQYVPPTPQSKGCARMFPDHQDELIAWLGLDDVVDPTWRKAEIGVTVTVQGEFRPLD